MAIDPSDPYFLQHSALAKQLAGLITNYGDASQLTPGYEQEFGLTGNDVSTAAGNPYSVLAQLKNQLAGDNTKIQTTAQSHGALYSGANAAQTANETQAAGQRNYNAQQTLQNQLQTLQTTDLGNLTDATTRAAAAAAADPTIPAPPAPPPPPSDAGAPPLPPIATIGPTNYTGDPRTGTSLYAPIKPPKPPKLPAIGGMGHIT